MSGLPYPSFMETSVFFYSTGKQTAIALHIQITPFSLFRNPHSVISVVDYFVFFLRSPTMTLGSFSVHSHLIFWQLPRLFFIHSKTCSDTTGCHLEFSTVKSGESDLSLSELILLTCQFCPLFHPLATGIYPNLVSLFIPFVSPRLALTPYFACCP